MNKQLMTQYFNFLKQAGFKYSKDEMGYYFDNGLKKFSVVRTGPFFQCYYNKKEKDQWKLQGKSQTSTDQVICLQWILQNIQSGK